MQKIITLIIFSILVFSAHAQFQKGNKVLGAGLSFATGTNDATPVPGISRNNSFGLALELGFVMKPNKLNGFFINGGYGESKTENSSLPQYNNSSSQYYSGAGYFTKVYKALGKGFFVYGEGRGGINYSEQKYNLTPSSKTQRYGLNIGLYPGLAYKWSDKFMLDLRFADFVAVGYNVMKMSSANSSHFFDRNFSVSSSLGLGYLSNIGIGARWIIN